MCYVCNTLVTRMKNMIKSKPTSIRLGERALFAKEKLKIESAQKLFDYFIDNFWFSHNPIPLGTVKIVPSSKEVVGVMILIEPL